MEYTQNREHRHSSHGSKRSTIGGGFSLSLVCSHRHKLSNMSATNTNNPSTQRKAVPASKTGRRNYVWSNEETQTLVNVLKRNLRYQLLIPGRATKEQEKGLKRKKSTMLQAIFPLVFPEEQKIEWGRIKSKILTMHRQYIAERERLG